ncbi:MAG: 2,3,4,5-tetrahydropyridine-2,6-dicarboxylate N-succinyltransferase, partial [Chloroflexota bacterium]|nr:2,3,4,5-tetrahydropyridine-2,6-dicarboxylate N-succinyltransferase [Chloroflexota bacterium]
VADAAWGAAIGQPPTALIDEVREVVADVVAALESGEARAAVPDSGLENGWRVEAWVKTGILLGFRLPGMTEYRDGPILAARDRSAYGVLDLLESESSRAAATDGAPWRVVPGGTTVRSGVHLEPGVTIMPPAYANIGAWVGRGSMIDSHVLVGSCAQIGRDVHISAAVQVGGVLEPAGARPVIVEDGAFIGGGAGLYEGVTVSRGAVIGAGTIITGGSRLIDLVAERELRGTPEAPLVVPPGAVVVPGTRPASSAWARGQGISVTVPVIVKYRDEGTDARVALEDALR